MVDDHGQVADDVRALVCDDDRITRAVISDLISERGGRVLAETGGAQDAIDLIERFRPNLVVCDMSLEAGSGMDIIEHLAGREMPCQVIVFSAFADSLGPVGRVALRVVSKPDFEQLQVALDAAIRDSTDAAATAERRKAARTLPPPSMRQDSGLDDPAEFYGRLAEAGVGDALLSVQVADADSLDLSRALRRAVRAQDLVVRRHDQLIVLLIGGGGDGPPAVLRRVAEAFPAVVDGAAIVELDPAVKAPTDALMDLPR